METSHYAVLVVGVALDDPGRSQAHKDGDYVGVGSFGVVGGQKGHGAIGVVIARYEPRLDDGALSIDDDFMSNGFRDARARLAAAGIGEEPKLILVGESLSAPLHVGRKLRPNEPALAT